MSYLLAAILISAFVLLATALLAIATRHDADMRATCARYDGITREGRR